MNKKKIHVIDALRCKSCGVCVETCPKKILVIGGNINGQGYAYVEQITPENCILCGLCGIVCPDVAIGVIEVAQD